MLRVLILRRRSLWLLIARAGLACTGPALPRSAERRTSPQLAVSVRPSFCRPQHVMDLRKAFGQHRCIPGLRRRPSHPVLRRAAKQPPGHDDDSVSLAEPSECDELAAIGADDVERTITAVGEEIGKVMS